MKKKGLIISTVVMVVVLIASLTTATYAWFTQSSVTSIDGFSLTVESSTALNIGLKANNTYDPNASTNAFYSGSCTYSGTAGRLGGTWTGEVGNLGPTIAHNIKYDAITKAIGLTSVTDDKWETPGVLTSQATAFPNQAEMPSGAQIISAILGNAKTSTLGDVTAAVPNGWTPQDGPAITADFAYLFLGVSPSKQLQPDTNKVYIVIQQSGDKAALGLATAMHVAYRLNGGVDNQETPDVVETYWTDVDVFGSDPTTGAHYQTLKSDTKAQCEIPIDTTGKGSTLNGNVTGAGTADVKTTFSGAAVLAIPLTQYQANKIDQLELVIYLAGSDSDCIDAAKGVTVNVGIFFGAQPIAA